MKHITTIQWARLSLVVSSYYERKGKKVCAPECKLFPVRYLYCWIACDTVARAGFPVLSTVNSSKVYSWLPLWRSNIKSREREHSKYLVYHLCYWHWMTFCVICASVHLSTQIHHQHNNNQSHIMNKYPDSAFTWLFICLRKQGWTLISFFNQF